jgi:hypothetical protein
LDEKEMNKEFKAKQFKDATVYTLESATSMGSSSIASVPMPMGGVRKRGDNLIAQEANKNTVPATTPRNFVAKNAKTGGAGAHKDKKRADKQGDVKHKNKQMDMAEEGYGNHPSQRVDPRTGKKYVPPKSPLGKGVAEGSGGNWYIRINGKILNDTKFNPVIFSSKDEARSHAMKLADKKRIPLSQIKLTKSWMDAPEPGVAEGSRESYIIVRTDSEGKKDVFAGNFDTYERAQKELDGLLAHPLHTKYKQKFEIKRKGAEQGVAEGAPELLKKEMPTHRHAEKLLAQNGVSKDDPDYHYHLNNTIKYLRQFGNIDLINKSDEQGVAEEWSKKYKSSINCSHPKGFSQKAHCAGKKKHTESMMTMEATCPDCGMCQIHGNLNEIAKGAKDSNGYTKCWHGKHAEGTKKGKNGGQVRNCVPNEGVAEDHSTSTGGWGQGAYAGAAGSSKWNGAGHDDSVHENPDWYNDEANSMTTSQLKSLYKHATKLRQAVKQMQAQGDTLEPWQQSKVTKAADYLDAVFQAVDDDHDMGEDTYMAELQAKLDEKIPKNAPVDVWIDDFAKAAKTPNAKGHHQFKNKNPEKIRQMAIAASYGAKNPSKKKK